MLFRSILIKKYPLSIQSRYKLENIDLDAFSLLEWIAKKKGFSQKNYLVNIERASATLLNDYRQGLLGRISLETPRSRINLSQNNQ